MRITFWGVRGSIAVPGPHTVHYGGNTTCVEVALSCGKTVIIDAGTGIRLLGDKLANSPETDLFLLLTHVHWDHIIGFPFFKPLFSNKVHIKLDGSRRGIEGLKRILSTNYIDGTWPISLHDVQAKIENTHVLPKRPLVIGETEIFSQTLQHPQGGMGFKFVEQTGTFVFITDNELTGDGWTGSKFSDFVKFCSEADVLVHDCQYFPEERNSRLGWGHSDTRNVTELAKESGVSELILFHHDPTRTDAGVDQMINECRTLLDEKGSRVKVSGACEGSSITL